MTDLNYSVPSRRCLTVNRYYVDCHLSMHSNQMNNKNCITAVTISPASSPLLPILKSKIKTKAIFWKLAEKKPHIEFIKATFLKKKKGFFAKYSLHKIIPFMNFFCFVFCLVGTRFREIWKTPYVWTSLGICFPLEKLRFA